MAKELPQFEQFCPHVFFKPHHTQEASRGPSATPQASISFTASSTCTKAASCSFPTGVDAETL